MCVCLCVVCVCVFFYDAPVPPRLFNLCLVDGVVKQSGMTALIIASHEGHKETVDLLLSHGANIEAKNNVSQASFSHTLPSLSSRSSTPPSSPVSSPSLPSHIDILVFCAFVCLSLSSPQVSRPPLPCFLLFPSIKTPLLSPSLLVFTCTCTCTCPCSGACAFTCVCSCPCTCASTCTCAFCLDSFFNVRALCTHIPIPIPIHIRYFVSTHAELCDR